MSIDMSELGQIEQPAFLTLTCREAQLLLRATTLDLGWKEMSLETQSTVRHYWKCKECYSLGIETILGVILPHQDCCEIWAANPDELCKGFNAFHPDTIREVLASEHVWGRDLSVFEGNIGLYPTCTDACQELTCTALRKYWQRAHSFTDKLNETDYRGGQIPMLITLFSDAGWTLDRVYCLQMEEIARISENTEFSAVLLQHIQVLHSITRKK